MALASFTIDNNSYDKESYNKKKSAYEFWMLMVVSIIRMPAIIRIVCLMCIFLPVTF